MRRDIIARYGEVHLKGGNRDFFLNRLVRNLSQRIGTLGKVVLQDMRIHVMDFLSKDEDYVLQITADTFGVVNASVATVVKSTVQDILNIVRDLKIQGTFKVCVNRADKAFPIQSTNFAAECGGIICENNNDAVVDVINPSKIIHIDIRKCCTLVYSDVKQGVGGLPVGTSGRALVLLSGGIDSPVAAYMAARRGMTVNFVHFATPPYTSDLALEKIYRLQKQLGNFIGNTKLFIVPFTEISREIQKKCAPEFMITIMRRFMIRIAEEIGVKNKLQAIFTGENLGQVASQTIEGITTNNFCATQLPILRPLLTYDKSEIISIAKRIRTYEISIEPHEDCCTIFVPQNPVTKPSREKAEREEVKLDVEELIRRTVGSYTIVAIPEPTNG